ncbi:MAG: iron chelate uptake ABC transporter family permease subunit [Firmicutes bacterium]|nr:iron chelate uptake ABC transporter family permease subunit [Bacillota bacterium]
MISSRHSWRVILGTLLVFCCIFIITLNIGKVQVTFADMVTVFLDKIKLSQSFALEVAEQKQTIFWNVRLPRAILASMVGAALSVAGAVMQTLYRNPLASPDVLGVTQAANLGAGIAIFFSPDQRC